MPFAARLGDKTSHGGTLGPPQPPLSVKVATVLIEGLPAAVVRSTHLCVKKPDLEMGPANMVLPGPPRGVFIGGAPAAAVGDRTVCGATIAFGARTVLIGGVV